jgi:hypothetical protein
LERSLLERHRAIDRSNGLDEMALHFMRGPKDEDADEALRKALKHLRSRAERAVEHLGAALAEPRDPRRWSAAFAALADGCHALRDSYSRGHARRAPGRGGPRVVALEAWEEAREPRRGLALPHLLRHDLRFEWPFARRGLRGWLGAAGRGAVPSRGTDPDPGAPGSAEPLAPLRR